MTPANKKMVQELGDHFKSLAKENPGAQTTMYALIKAQRMILDILSDVFMRPEANS